MFLQLALALVLALSGLVTPAPARDSSAHQGGAVAQTASASSATTKGLPSAAGAPSDGVVLKNVDIVVPPVQPSGTVAAPNAPLEAQATPGVVVADQLVAPKRVESEVVKATGYQTLGVSWPKNASVGDLGSQFRTRTNGKWSGWVALEPTDAAPDPGSADAAHAVRGGTDPVSIGSADAVQLAFTASAKGGPKGMSLALIDSPEKPASDGVVVSNAVDSTTGGSTTGGSTTGGSTAASEAIIQTVAFSGAAVQAAATAPRIISRAAWGAPAQRCTPGVASTLVGAAVHHTAGSNTYTTIAGSEAQIRGDAAFHLSLGWCDLGYNFVVDKWGNIYEGRANSLTQAVIGAHAGGFNTGTVGVAMLGTYTSVNPTPAMQSAVARIIGWRLGAYGVDPKTSMSYHFAGVPGDGQRYHNVTVTLPRVSGHRDVWLTACPGNGGYAALPNIRAMASSFGYALRFTQARSVVKSLYTDLLNRPVDSSGLATWSALLAGGTGQPALAAALTKSREHGQPRGGKAYLECLGGQRDAGGVRG